LSRLTALSLAVCWVGTTGGTSGLGLGGSCWLVTAIWWGRIGGNMIILLVVQAVGRWRAAFSPIDPPTVASLGASGTIPGFFHPRRREWRSSSINRGNAGSATARPNWAWAPSWHRMAVC